MVETDYRQTLGALNCRLLRHPLSGAARVGKVRREVHQPARPATLRCRVVSLTKSYVHVHARRKTHVIPSATSAGAAKPRAPGASAAFWYSFLHARRNVVRRSAVAEDAPGMAIAGHVVC